MKCYISMLIGNIISFIKTGVLLGKFFTSKTSSQEREQLKHRLHNLKDNNKKQLFEQILDSEELKQRHAIHAECDIEKAWEQIQQRLEMRNKNHRILKRYSLMLQSAASIAVILLVAGGVIYHSHIGRQKRVLAQIAQIRPSGLHATLYLADGEQVILDGEDSTKLHGKAKITGENQLAYRSTTQQKQRDNESKEEYNTIVTPCGCEYQITLVDGTKVWLNATSSLKFFTTLQGNERRVWLEGEAYFEVAHNAQRPFIVESGGQRIRVLGTHFNVNSYRSEQAIYTTLIEGSVEVSALKGNIKATLRSGEQATYCCQNNESISIQEVDTSLATAWRDGSFIFSQATITEIMEDLSRWYSFDFEVSPHLNKLQFSGQFPRYEDLDKIIMIIASTGTGMQIDYDGKKITLR